MKAIIGSAGVPLTTDVISTVVGLIAMDSDSIAVRGPQNPATLASPIEELAMSLGSKVGRDVVVWRTSRGEPSPYRDRNLVGNVQRVYAFFQKGWVMSGGTGNVVRTAIEQGIAVQAWEVDPLGSITYVGSLEGEEDFSFE